MKYFIGLVMLISMRSAACDICGCFMGITPYDNQSTVGFLHRYRVFNGYRSYEQKSKLFPTGAYKVMHTGHDSIVPTVARVYSSKDYESYKVYELRAKYFIHHRIELNAIIPFNNNKSKEDSIVYEHTGLGDPTFFAGYHLIKKVDYETFLHRLIVGGGIKIPSGNYYAKNDKNVRLPFLMQPGTGSLDYFFYSNYVFGYRKFGFSLNSMYKVNGSNYYHERIGNSISNYLNIFIKVKAGDFIFIPSAQLYYEYTKGLYVNHSLQKGTQMNCLLAGPGLDVFYKNVSLSASVQFRAYEETATNNLSSSGRIVVGLTYNFNQKKYLFGKKLHEEE
ncbi:MAG TPA: hypothetical protein VGF30_08700 [Bacteroidia bacterium]